MENYCMYINKVIPLRWVSKLWVNFQVELNILNIDNKNAKASGFYCFIYLSHWKDPNAGKDWRQEEKGLTEDKMVR